jgi:hypothetical protein
VIVWSRLYGCLLAYLLAYMHLLFDFLDLLFGPSLALIPLALGYVIVRFIFMETLSLDPIRVYPTARKVRVQVGERERERERDEKKGYGSRAKLEASSRGNRRSPPVPSFACKSARSTVVGRQRLIWMRSACLYMLSHPIRINTASSLLDAKFDDLPCLSLARPPLSLPLPSPQKRTLGPSLSPPLPKKSDPFALLPRTKTPNSRSTFAFLLPPNHSRSRPL